MFVILQKYDFSSKSQHNKKNIITRLRCLWYCKSTIFQANHNCSEVFCYWWCDVCDTAKVRFFKQITTLSIRLLLILMMFVILQKYDFSSKSQQIACLVILISRCLWYCKSTIFQANHNIRHSVGHRTNDVCDTAKVRFFKQITTHSVARIAVETMFVILQKYDFSSKSQRNTVRPFSSMRCLWYCKSTIFQANHNLFIHLHLITIDVCDTAKVRFFKQITTVPSSFTTILWMFVILQKYDFSSKSQRNCSC